MNLDHVFKKTTKGLYHTGINPSVPDDLLCKCKKCGVIYKILVTKPLGHLKEKEKLDEGWHYYCKREGCGWEDYKQE